MAEIYQDAGYHDNAGGDKSTAVRWWVRWTRRMKIGMVQRASELNLASQRAVEDKLILFAVWLVEGRGLKPATARAYVSTVRAWHERRFGAMLPNYSVARLKAVFKGMERLVGGKPKKLRRGVRTQLLAQAIERSLGNSPLDVTLRAACEVAFCGLLRVSEYTSSVKGAYDKRRLPVVGDVSFGVDEDGEYATVMTCPSKKGSKSQGKSVPIELRDGRFLQPVASLRAMLRQRKAAPDEPLFVGGGAPLSSAKMTAVVKWLMESVGEDKSLYGSHSLRIGGATAALAGGVPPEVIRIMGRWDSEVYEIYCRMSRQAARRLGVAVASTAFTDFEGEYTHEELY